ncbi:immunity protein YezG family protein [Rossellomorea marisflavi]|uniref:immunity protein YezG family protein n=1 Tax=Rossellomorea marisflavi TaxID=189381 RepID=UPI003D2E16FB
MSFEIELNKLYNEIAQQVNDMILIVWGNFNFYGEVKEEEGGVFFFFTPNEEQHVLGG